MWPLHCQSRRRRQPDCSALVGASVPQSGRINAYCHAARTSRDCTGQQQRPAADMDDRHVADGVPLDLQANRVLDRTTPQQSQLRQQLQRRMIQQQRTRLRRQPGRRRRSTCSRSRRRSLSWTARRPLWTRPLQTQVPTHLPAWHRVLRRAWSLQCRANEFAQGSKLGALACVMCLFICRARRSWGCCPSCSTGKQRAAGRGACRVLWSRSRYSAAAT
jgi:hypothetical protein